MAVALGVSDRRGSGKRLKLRKSFYEGSKRPSESDRSLFSSYSQKRPPSPAIFVIFCAFLAKKLNSFWSDESESGSVSQDTIEDEVSRFWVGLFDQKSLVLKPVLRPNLRTQIAKFGKVA
ncbi:hypothetical protein L596_020219 [Steinernema carpocapsae]|uniref:Uncharacterized protein n=1 Tax=Steinernema carpocapsae TaxID=34508 RepID=A0A4U5MTP1_STECR|nr:hypothetical protein L596_020219 [Steinernema carpocapsae]